MYLGGVWIYLAGVWKDSGRCLNDWFLEENSRGCLITVWKVLGRCLEAGQKVSRRCLEGVLEVSMYASMQVCKYASM